MDEQLKEIVDKIVDFLHPTRIYLFGSRARGDHRPDSDYDIVVIYDGPKPERDVELEIRRLFRPPGFSMDLFIMTSAQVVRYKHVANSLAREIAHRGVMLYG